MRLFLALAVEALTSIASAQPPVSREQALEVLRPYDGASSPGVNVTTLHGKIVAGYQGWFTAPGDGSDQGWRHYSRRGEFRPGQSNIDLWPDVSELDVDEQVPTAFHHADGRPAFVFSSHHRKTVLRHFRWMRDYGIDGAFVQRFVVATRVPLDLRHCNVVLSHCREGANLSGRCYAVMYDLSGLPAGGVQLAIDDWKQLVDRMRVGRGENDHAYLKHQGRPVVAVWGIGFSDGRKYTLAECEKFIEFLKDDPRYGGNTVMVGVPTYWRTLQRDAAADPALHEALKKGDIISPWTVGRFNTPEGAARYAETELAADLAWCREQGKEYLPVAFPGFSWQNMNPGATSAIPRRGGEFLWRQYVEARRAGATMLYQAMFDELDEATAIFKCTNDPPVGESKFVAEPELSSDHYLWLTGLGGKLLRGEIPAENALPARKR
jgi:hypothetical protein